MMRRSSRRAYYAQLFSHGAPKRVMFHIKQHKRALLSPAFLLQIAAKYLTKKSYLLRLIRHSMELSLDPDDDSRT